MQYFVNILNYTNYVLRYIFQKLYFYVNVISFADFIEIRKINFTIAVRFMTSIFKQIKTAHSLQKSSKIIDRLTIIC